MISGYSTKVMTILYSIQSSLITGKLPRLGKIKTSQPLRRLTILMVAFTCSYRPKFKRKMTVEDMIITLFQQVQLLFCQTKITNVSFKVGNFATKDQMIVRKMVNMLDRMPRLLISFQENKRKNFITGC